MKRFIAAVLLISMMSVFRMPIFVYGANTENDNDLKLAISLLDSLNIISKKTAEENLSNKITKKDFAEMLYKLVNAENEIKANNVYFVDTYQNDKVNQLAEIGIISQKESRFYPERNLSFAAALEYSVNATGWGVKARAMGGNSREYLRVAKEIKLFEIINENSLSFNDAVTYETAIRILYGAADAKVCSVSAISNDAATVSANGSETLLSERHDVYKIEGKVEADQYTALYTHDMPAGDNELIINGQGIFYYGDDYENMIGRYVNAFYKDKNGTKTIIALVKEGEKDTVTISSKDIIKFDENILSYYDQNDKKRRLHIPNGAAIIYNNSCEIGTSQLDLINNLTNATVTVLKSEDSGKYDVIIVDEYVNAMVLNIDNDNGIIYTDRTDEFAEVKYGEFSVKKFLSATTSAPMSIGTLNKNSSVTIKAAKNKGLIILYINTLETFGMVDSVYTTDGKVVVTIDGKEYKVASDHNVGDQFIPGNYYKFYTNNVNEIVSIKESIGKEAMKVAYIYGYSTDKVIDDTVKVKLFTQDGEHSVYELADKITLDGEKIEATKVKGTFINGETGELNRGIIRYLLNQEGKIIEIDSPAASKTEREAQGTIYKAFPLATRTYAHTENMFKPNYPLSTTSTFIFIVPPEGQPLEEERFNVVMYKGRDKSFGWSGGYTVEGYKFSDLSSSLDVVVWPYNPDQYFGGGWNMMVDNLSQELYNGDVRNAISGLLFDGTYKKMYVDDECDISDIGTGDVIKFVTFAGSDIISNVGKVIDYDTDTKTAKPMWGDTISGSAVYTYGMFGNVATMDRKPNGVSETYMKITRGSDVKTLSFVESKFPMVIYDDGELRVNDYASMRSADMSEAGRSDSVFILGEYPYVTFMFVYAAQD